MKKVLLALLLLLGINLAFAEENIHNLVLDGDKIIYQPSNEIWVSESDLEDQTAYTKKLYEGDGGYSLYSKADGSFGFISTTSCEILKNGKLIIVDNNLLKYSKLIVEDGRFVQIPLTDEEINELFPNVEILKISTIDSDNKMWLHKPLFKKKTILLVNDTNRYFHKITCKSNDVQDDDIRGLITVSRYGIIRFTHLGEYKGKLTFYIR